MIEFGWQFVRETKKKYYLAFVFCIIGTLVSIFLPQITNIIIDFCFNFSSLSYEKLNWLNSWLVNGFLGEPQSTKLFTSLIIMFLSFSLIYAVCKFLSEYTFNIAGTKISGNARKKGLEKLSKQGRFGASDAFIILTNDINSMRDSFIIHIPAIFSKIIISISAVVLSFFINVYIGLILVVVIPFLSFIEYIYIKKSKIAIENTRQKEGTLNNYAELTAQSIREIKVFGTSKYVSEKFNEINNEYYSAKEITYGIVNKYTFIVNLIKSLSYGAVIILAGTLTLDGLLSVGGFVTLVTYSLLALTAMLSTINSIFNLLECRVGMSKYYKFMQDKNEKIHFGNKQLETDNPSIVFKKIKLDLSSRVMFEDLSFDVPYGKKIGIFSTQGEGKTLIFNMLLRMYEQDKGELLINNENIQDFSLESVRQQFSYVSETPNVFHDSLKNNIILFSKKDEKKYQKVIQELELDKFFAKRKHGENEVISENGYEIPSQEKQLINIARALYRDANILLLDSPFNRFNEQKTQELIDKLFDIYKDKSIIFASKKPADLKKCDKIYVLKKGVIVESGTYDELINMKDSVFQSAVLNKE